MSPAATNMGIAAVGLLVLLSYVPFRDVIPAGDGFGYDGVRYATWAKHVPVTLFPEGLRPPYIKSDLNSYDARRFLPSTVIHYAMGAAGVPRTSANVLAAFTAANLILLTLSLYWWCRASDASGLPLRGKWIGFLALLVQLRELEDADLLSCSHRHLRAGIGSPQRALLFRAPLPRAGSCHSGGCICLADDSLLRIPAARLSAGIGAANPAGSTQGALSRRGPHLAGRDRGASRVGPDRVSRCHGLQDPGDSGQAADEPCAY